MNNALDAMVDEFAPAMREAIGAMADQMLRTVEEANPGGAAEIDDEKRAVLKEVIVHRLDETLPKLKRLTGSGVERYETRLRGAGLGAAAARPILAELDEALTEFGAIRDVLAHRHGRVDARALEQTPSLSGGTARGISSGWAARTTRRTRRRFAATGRTSRCGRCRSWLEATDNQLPNLTGWRDYYRLGV